MTHLIKALACIAVVIIFFVPFFALATTVQALIVPAVFCVIFSIVAGVVAYDVSKEAVKYAGR